MGNGTRLNSAGGGRITYMHSADSNCVTEVPSLLDGIHARDSIDRLAAFRHGAGCAMIELLPLKPGSSEVTDDDDATIDRICDLYSNDFPRDRA